MAKSKSSKTLPKSVVDEPMLRQNIKTDIARVKNLVSSTERLALQDIAKDVEVILNTINDALGVSIPLSQALVIQKNCSGLLDTIAEMSSVYRKAS